jgi:hypothetical protein
VNVTVTTRFDEQRQSAPWKNEVAAQLNLLLDDAGYDQDRRYVAAVISIVQRVMQFEGIEIAP